MGIDRTFLPRPLLCNLFLQKALVAAANQHEETLFLIDNQEEENLSPLGFTQEGASLLRAQSHQAKHYLKQALLELGIKRATALPPLSLIFPKGSFETFTLLKTLKKIWEKELGIHCQLVSFPQKKRDQPLPACFF